MNRLGGAALAILGVLAYKNRDKLGPLLQTGLTPPGEEGHGGILDQILHNTGLQQSGLSDVLDRFRNGGSGTQADSWVGTGANQPIEREHVEKAIDPETLDQLVEQTGLSREELIERLRTDLPEAVDRMTPDGKLPEITKSPIPSGGGIKWQDAPQAGSPETGGDGGLLGNWPKPSGTV